MAQVAALDNVVLSLAVSEKALVLLEDEWLKPCQFGAHPFRVFPEVNHRAVFKEIPPLRIDALKLDVVFQSLPIPFKHRPEDLRQREDGWTKVKAEALRL